MFTKRDITRLFVAAGALVFAATPASALTSKHNTPPHIVKVNASLPATITDKTDCNNYDPNHFGSDLTCKDKKIKKQVEKIHKLDKSIQTKDKKIKQNNDEASCLAALTKNVESNGRETADMVALPPDGQACKIARERHIIISSL